MRYGEEVKATTVIAGLGCALVLGVIAGVSMCLICSAL